jgi:hypothetical protein
MKPTEAPLSTAATKRSAHRPISLSACPAEKLTMVDTIDIKGGCLIPGQCLLSINGTPPPSQQSGRVR